MIVPIEAAYHSEIDSPHLDCLTGLVNHGFFQLALEREVNIARRHERPFSLALIDVDSFTRYNRNFGPVRGDLVLKEIADVIKKNIRDVDLAARYSGDVFAIILTECEPLQARNMLERLRSDVEALKGPDTTISIGVVGCPAASTNKESLIDKAQDALLRAKSRGKNRATIFKEAEKQPTDRIPRILIVDDIPTNVKLLESILLPFGYEVFRADSGEEALSIIKRTDIDLILLDIMMPVIDGFEVCRHIKSSESTRMIPVIMVTALDDVEAKVKAIEAGADDFITKPPNKLELLARVKSLIKVKSLNSNLTNLESVLFSLANTVEAKDAYTRGHTRRVSEIAVELAKRMGLPAKDIREIKIGGIIHDIGKIGVPRAVLCKPGRLDPEEFELMKKHPTIGYEICLPLKQSLGVVLDIIYYHHEKLDGSGYPVGLKGENIPIGAKVMTVADIYDALTSDRPYRKAMSKEKALEILRQEMDEGKLDRQILEYLIEII